MSRMLSTYSIVYYKIDEEVSDNDVDNDAEMNYLPLILRILTVIMLRLRGWNCNQVESVQILDKGLNTRQPSPIAATSPPVITEMQPLQVNTPHTTSLNQYLWNTVIDQIDDGCINMPLYNFVTNDTDFIDNTSTINIENTDKNTVDILLESSDINNEPMNNLDNRNNSTHDLTVPSCSINNSNHGPNVDENADDMEASNQTDISFYELIPMSHVEYEEFDDIGNSWEKGKTPRCKL